MKLKTLLALYVIAFLFNACKKEAVIAAGTIAATSSIDNDYIENNFTVQKKITRKIDDNIGGFLEALPANYAKHVNAKYPVIIFLHGLGNTGTGSATDLNKIINLGGAIPNLINDKKFPSNFIVGSDTFHFIVISPQFLNWPQPAEINDMYNYVIKNYKVDTNRIYVTGLSMGGGGTWDFAWNYPARPAAIVPMSGASWPTTEKAEPIAKANLPVWAFHNEDDSTVPAWYSINYVSYINSFEPLVKAKLTLWPTGGHDTWKKASDPNYKENGKNIYEWMLSHKKKG